MLVAFAVVIFPAPPLLAADATGYVLLATDYVWRGVSQTDGDPAAQIGADIRFETGVFAGLWLSTVDIQSAPDHERDLESNFYLGYSLEVGERWLLGASVIARDYPGSKGDVDYDYVEYALSASLDDRYWLEYAYSPDIYNTGRHTHDIELFAEWPFPADTRLTAGLGHYDVSDLAGDDYNYWELGLTRAFGPLDVDLRYHDTDGWVPIFSSPSRSDATVVLGLRFTF